MKTGLFIGRFQPFHNGHLDAINQILKECDKIIIGIGSSQENNTEENPFSAEERKKMIEKVLPDIEIVFIPDINDDEGWAEHVEKLCSKFDVAYTGNEWTKECFEIQGKYKIIEVKKNLDIEATRIRELIKEGKRWEDLVPEDIVEIIKKKKELLL